MAPWAPGMPWPSGMAGGASAPAWGGQVRFWVRAGIAPGATFHMGAHPLDRLDSGNVLGPGSSTGGVIGSDRLWVDLTCDATAVEIAGGSGSSQGIFSKVDAATLTATIADPAGDYDPLNTGGPFAYGGRSRLVPGVPVEAFAEVVNAADSTWKRYPIFAGTADSWGEDWTANPREREAKLVATDATKTWARYDRPEQSPAGAGDTVAQRIARLVTFFGWPGTVVNPPGGSTRTLQATTMAQPGWELLNRATDDELGVIFLTPDGKLRWLNRETWATIAAPRLTVGCAELAVGGVTPYDVLVDATPTNMDLQLRNSVHAARAGGTEQAVASDSSVDRYGVYDFRRTDLGLADDAQVGAWATKVVELYAFPQVALSDVTMLPGVDAASAAIWSTVLDWQLFTDIVRVRWAPPDLPSHLVDGQLRVVGWRHAITRGEWAVTWQLVAARPMLAAGAIFHMGAHASDRLDSNFVLG
jgi:hypothetical protein